MCLHQEAGRLSFGGLRDAATIVRHLVAKPRLASIAVDIAHVLVAIPIGGGVVSTIKLPFFALHEFLDLLHIPTAIISPWALDLMFNSIHCVAHKAGNVIIISRFWLFRNKVAVLKARQHPVATPSACSQLVVEVDWVEPVFAGCINAYLLVRNIVVNR